MHLAIRGRVQGVGYRAWVEFEAAGLGLHGWVRNRHDGSVETVLSGDADAVASMIARCEDGPPAAIVETVAVTDWADVVETGFRVLPTA